MSEKRSSFTGKIGFVLAAAGSAVGLGNIWRFPYLAAKYGGGIFLLVYIILAVTFGFTLMVAEVAIGRKTGISAIGAYKMLDKRFSAVGWLAAVIPVVIMPYYSVIGGWVLKYMVGFLTGEGTAMAQQTYFTDYISETWEPLIWFAIVLTAAAVIVLCGVQKGVEKVSKFMMPILVVLTVVIALYTIFAIPGAMEGVKYYLMPDFSKFSIMTVVAAMGQLFYSMSLAMGIMITFGSYMKKDISIEGAVSQVEIFDTGVAFLAGLMIIPAVFAFSGGDESALNQGTGLMFVTLPKVFDAMPGGHAIGAAFFTMVLLAALTSIISLMETIVSTLQDKLSMSRRTAIFTTLVFGLLLGFVSAFGSSIWSGVRVLGMKIQDFFDFISNSIMMPIVAFFTCLLVGYVIKPKAVAEEVELEGKRFRRKKLFSVVIRYIAPVCMVLILISSILDAFGIVKI